jgi:predicted transcriptional regulator
MIGGNRISSQSYSTPSRSPSMQERKQEPSPRTRLIIELIPIYPSSISIYELARRTGVSRRVVEANLATCEGRSLICQEGLQFSRLEGYYVD